MRLDELLLEAEIDSETWDLVQVRTGWEEAWRGCNESTESRHGASEPARSPYQHSDSLEDVLGPWGLVPAPLYMGEQGERKG